MKNVGFATVAYLIMDSNFKIIYAMVVTIWHMLCLNISDITIIAVKNVDYRFIIYKITKFEAIKLLENTVLEDIGFYKKILLVLIFTFFV